MKYIAAAILLSLILALAGCTMPVAGHPDELSLVPPETSDYIGKMADEGFDPGAPLEEEADDDIVDAPLSEEELIKNLEEKLEDPDMLTFDDGADAGEDYLDETPLPEPTATPLEKDPYYTKVDVTNQVVTVYGLDANGNYTTVVRQMICSTGKNATPTPLGVFNIPGPVVRWGYFPKYDVYAQYLVRIKGSILFHSVLYKRADLDTLSVSSWYNLGKKASHGCVRMLPEDGKWLYENLKSGYVVEVYEGKKDAALTKSLLPPPPPVSNAQAALATPTPIPTETPEPTPEETLEATFDDVVEPDNGSVMEEDPTPDQEAVVTPETTPPPTEMPIPQAETETPVAQNEPTREQVTSAPATDADPEIVPVETPPPAPLKESEEEQVSASPPPPPEETALQVDTPVVEPAVEPEVVPVQNEEPTARTDEQAQTNNDIPPSLPEPVVIQSE